MIFKSSQVGVFQRFSQGSRLPAYPVFPSPQLMRLSNTTFNSANVRMYVVMNFNVPSYLTTLQLFFGGSGGGTQGTCAWELRSYSSVTRTIGAVVASGTHVPSTYALRTIGSSINTALFGTYILVLRNSDGAPATNYFVVEHYADQVVDPELSLFTSADAGSTYDVQTNGSAYVIATCGTATGYVAGRVGFPIRVDNFSATAGIGPALHSNSTIQAFGWAHIPKDSISPVKMRASMVGAGTLASRGNIVAEVYQGTPIAPTLVARSLNTQRDDRTSTSYSAQQQIDFWFSGNDNIQAGTWTAWVIRAEGGNATDNWKVRGYGSFTNADSYSAYIAGGPVAFHDGAYLVESTTSPISFGTSSATSVPYLECYARPTGILGILG